MCVYERERESTSIFVSVCEREEESEKERERERDIKGDESTCDIRHNFDLERKTR